MRRSSRAYLPWLVETGDPAPDSRQWFETEAEAREYYAGRAAALEPGGVCRLFRLLKQDSAAIQGGVSRGDGPAAPPAVAERAGPYVDPQLPLHLVNGLNGKWVPRFLVPVAEDGNFGHYLKVDLPSNADSMVLAVERVGTGSVQLVHILLPHQLYTRRVEELFAADPDARSLWILPVGNARWRQVADLQFQQEQPDPATSAPLPAPPPNPVSVTLDREAALSIYGLVVSALRSAPTLPTERAVAAMETALACRPAAPEGGLA
jgi:hypothetical protein